MSLSNDQTARCGQAEKVMPESTGKAPESLPTGTLTLMMRRLPRRFSQEEVREEIDKRGFRGLYDFLYVPWDMRQSRNRGFGFISFTDELGAQRFHELTNGEPLMHERSKPLEVIAADVQGSEALAQHFAANSSLGKPMFLRSPPTEVLCCEPPAILRRLTLQRMQPQA